MKTHSLNAWKKLSTRLTILLLATSVAHATKYRPPTVEEDTPSESEEPVVPAKKVKVARPNSPVELTVPKPDQRPKPPKPSVQSVPPAPGQPQQQPRPLARQQPRQRCIRTLAEYNANASIREAVGGIDGSRIFTTWHNHEPGVPVPVSIKIRPQGGAVVNAAGQEQTPSSIELCLGNDDRPVLKFNGHSIRLNRGPLREIKFKYQDYNLRFTTKNPAASTASPSAALNSAN